VDRPALADDDVSHQVEGGGEKQLVNVLPLASLVEQGVQTLGTEHAGHGRLRHDRDRTVVDEAVKDRLQHTKLLAPRPSR
jgi:hypothetical protein